MGDSLRYLLIALGAGIWIGFLASQAMKNAAVESSSKSVRSPDKNESVRPHDLAATSLQLATPDLARRIGFVTARTTTCRLPRMIAAIGETAYDSRRTAKVFARVDAVVRELRADPLQFVRKGDVVAVLDAAVVGTNKAQYLASLAAVELAEDTLARVRDLTREAVVPLKTEIEAKTALNQAKSNLREAEMKLRNLGFLDADILRLTEVKHIDSVLEVVAPIDGYVVAWDVNIGEAVEATSQVVALVDTSTMWLWIDVYEADIGSVAAGQRIEFKISGGDEAFAGEVTAISTEVNPTTRTTRVRAAIANRNGRLRAHQFGRVNIVVEPERDRIIVPIGAVQRDGAKEIVFVADGQGVYHSRTVVSRAMDRRDVVEIVDGLKADEEVVTTGSFVLFSQLHREQIADEVD